MLSRSLKCFAAPALVAGAFFLAPATAKAQNYIAQPGAHKDYKLEAEPHLTLGVDSIYGTGGIGLGGRFSFPVVQNGFIPSANNNVAVGVGLDFVHYSDCFAFQETRCGANYLFVPVVMQWNFFFAPEWSAFVEPGVSIFAGFYDECERNSGRRCIVNEPSRFGWRPAFFLGGRYHFSNSTALTLRIGYPSLTVGVSFM